MTGIIRKSLSGFYYVDLGKGELLACRARGKFRHQKLTPLVGDRVQITRLDENSGVLDEIEPRKNQFQRPAIANIDQLVLIASGAIPITDPFLLDRMISLAEYKGCEPVICINKWDLEQMQPLLSLYQKAGFCALRISAKTGEGLEELRAQISGKVSAFTGNSGVGKSSILNALEPGIGLAVGEISEKLGRGRHTTRHVELYRLQNGALVADTPGFSAFDTGLSQLMPKEKLAWTFREFRPYLEDCRFVGCSHRKEKGCAVLAALAAGEISQSRYQSYARLYDEAKEQKIWQLPK